MDNEQQLIQRIKIFRTASFVILGAYFLSKYALKLGEGVQIGLFALLLVVLLGRSYFEYKLTGNKTRLYILIVLALVAAGIGTYFYLNPAS